MVRRGRGDARFCSDLKGKMKEFEIVCRLDGEPKLKEIEARAQGRRWRLKKRSIDARKEPLRRYLYEAYEENEEMPDYVQQEYLDVHDARPVIIVGAGPAGMFAALKLLTLGRRPVILERGKDVHGRKYDMARLSREGVVDPDSNYCYGEGGAGAFSDGKLYTRSSKRGDIGEVLHQLVAFGASKDILVDSHPHIGSDKLPLIVENIRRCIVSHGGEYHFNSKVVNISGTTVTTSDGKTYTADRIILATGHSARDVYEMLDRSGGALEAKGFAMGVRVEHPQEKINYAQYHGKWKTGMPAAEYSFVEQVDGRGVFSFCMCPGGILVPSATENGTIVMNGMSNSSRNGQFANAGVVVQIEPEDVEGDGPFRLMDFQQETERRMYEYVRSNAQADRTNPMAAPAQRMEDFCNGKLSAKMPQTSYHPGVVPAPLHELLPEMVASRLRKVFPKVRIKGYFTNAALLVGVESRTSSPIRIPRDPVTLKYVSAGNIYPCGEGAGYSGGIVSSAIDGIRCAVAAAAAED